MSVRADHPDLERLLRRQLCAALLRDCEPFLAADEGALICTRTRQGRWQISRGAPGGRPLSRSSMRALIDRLDQLDPWLRDVRSGAQLHELVTISCERPRDRVRITVDGRTWTTATIAYAYITDAGQEAAVLAFLRAMSTARSLLAERPDISCCELSRDNGVTVDGTPAEDIEGLQWLRDRTQFSALPFPVHVQVTREGVEITSPNKYWAFAINALCLLEGDRPLSRDR